MVDDGDARAEAVRRARGLQTEQATADHDRMAAAHTPRIQALRVAKIPEREHARQRHAGRIGHAR